MIVLPVKPRKSIGWHYTQGLEGRSDGSSQIGNASASYIQFDHVPRIHYSVESASGEHDSDDGLGQLAKLG